MTKDRGAQQFNRFMALFFVAALLAIAALLYTTNQQDLQNNQSARKYTCSLAYATNSSEWQNCVDDRQ